jgi:hypothetical protein
LEVRLNCCGVRSVDDDDDDDDKNNIIIIIIINNRNTAHVECKNTGDASNNGSNWNHFKILQKILEQRTGTARYQGTTENSYIGRSTHTAGSANVEAQKGLILQTALYVPLTVRAEWLRHCIP